MEAKQLFYGDESSVGEARSFMRDVLAETGAPADVVDSAVLLISELATNVTLHARTHLQVSVRVDDSDLWAEVKDWNSRVPQPCHTPVDATSGRGLQMLDILASNWGIRVGAEGKVVWFRLRLNGNVPANNVPATNGG